MAPQGDREIHCALRGNAVTTAPVSDDVPVIALFERTARHSGFDVPSLLVWRDGTVITREGYAPLTQATVARDRVEALAASLRSTLRDAPANAAISDWTDQPSVQIVLRDGDASRVVGVYGLQRATQSIPPAAAAVASAYHALLAWRATGGAPAPTTYPRPPCWPEELPTYRGQWIIDQLVFCARRAPDRS